MDKTNIITLLYVMQANRSLQVLSNSWDRRPCGYNRHGTKSRGLLCPWAGEGQKPKQLQGRSTDVDGGMARHSLPNNYRTLEGKRWVQ